jgi:hypothetical protein
MAVRVQLNYAGIREVQQLPVVRAALSARSRPIAARARSIAAGQGSRAIADSITTEDGTRPKGRSYSRVVSRPTAEVQRDRTATPTARRRVLARAADIGKV